MLGSWPTKVNRDEWPRKPDAMSTSCRGFRNSVGNPSLVPCSFKEVGNFLAGFFAGIDNYLCSFFSPLRNARSGVLGSVPGENKRLLRAIAGRNNQFLPTS